MGKTVRSTIRYIYDGEGKQTKKLLTLADGTEQVYIVADEENSAAEFIVGENTIRTHSKTDSFGRKTFDEFQLGTGFVSRQFTYHVGEETREHRENAALKSSPTTQLVSEILLSDGRTLAYEYDAEERITSVTESYKTADNKTIVNKAEYTYDALGQLLTETVNGSVVNRMEYDNYGNIKRKNDKEYLYDTTWHDLLTSYDGYEIEYDEQGNPTKYLGHTLTWEKGRQLKSFDGNTYTYNANGIRTSKTVNGVRHDYVLEGTKILQETWGENKLIPIYDNEESVCGIIYNGTPHYFLKNLQGDIIAIANSNGEVEARYTYDAWGAITNISGTDEGISIAVVNPFRYRSYYYDSEIQMYYLQSRYYDAGVGRFVNADESEMGCLSTHHLFSYAQNNPINETDIFGKIIESLLFKIFAGVFCGFFIQLFDDVLDYLIQCIVKGRGNAKFGADLGDYLSSILSYTLKFVNPFGKSRIISAAISVYVPLAVKYGYKLISGNKISSYSLITDILFATMNFIAACLLTWNQKNKISKIKKHGQTRKQIKAQKIQIKESFKVCGQRIDLAFEISEEIINFILKWVNAFKG